MPEKLFETRQKLRIIDRLTKPDDWVDNYKQDPINNEAWMRIAKLNTKRYKTLR
jgi:hypothetical protein